MQSIRSLYKCTATLLSPAPLHEMQINNFCSCNQKGVSSVRYLDTAPAEDKAGVQNEIGISFLNVRTFLIMAVTPRNRL